MGIKITVPNAMYGATYPELAEVTAFLAASGISSTKKEALNKFVFNLKKNKLWEKLSHIGLFVGDNYSQNQYNLKDSTVLLTTAGATNTINKGIALENSKVVTTSIDQDVLQQIVNGGGHISYLANNTQPAATVVLCNNLGSANTPGKNFLMSGSFASKHGAVIQDTTYATQITPEYVGAGLLTANITTGKKYQYFKNKAFLDEFQRTTATTDVDCFVTLGDPNNYTANVTLSFLAFGKTALTNDEVLIFHQLVKEVIFETLYLSFF